jgi:hypothetical protein
MMPIFLYQVVLAININWSEIVDPLEKMFLGGQNYTDLSGVPQTTQGIIGDPMLLGAFIFIVLFILTLMFGLGMLVGSVVIIPSLFAVFNYIPDLRILVAIICGLVFGLGLQKLIRR